MKIRILLSIKKIVEKFVKLLKLCLHSILTRYFFFAKKIEKLNFVSKKNRWKIREILFTFIFDEIFFAIKLKIRILFSRIKSLKNSCNFVYIQYWRDFFSLQNWKFEFYFREKFVKLCLHLILTILFRYKIEYFNFIFEKKIVGKSGNS